MKITYQNKQNKRYVSDSAETSFGSSFGCFESKLVSKDTLVWREVDCARSSDSHAVSLEKHFDWDEMAAC